MSQINLDASLLNGFELTVDFDYQPYEPPERGPEAQYPGAAESISVEHVTLNGHNITNLLSEAQLQELEDEILERIHQPDCDSPCSYDIMRTLL